MFNIFNKKTEPKLNTELEKSFKSKLMDAFGRIRQDIFQIDSGLRNSKEDIEKLKQWVEFLNQNQQNIVRSNESLSKGIYDIHASHSRLHEERSKHRSELEKAKLGLENRHEIVRSELSDMRELMEKHAHNLSISKESEGKLKEEITDLKRNYAEIMAIYEEKHQKVSVENLELRKKLAEIEDKLEEIGKKEILEPEIREERQIMPKKSFQSHILSRIMPNRRNYVLKEIMDLIKTNKYSTKEIEEIIVREKSLCGRTSFYSYLRELKANGSIDHSNIGDRLILVATKHEK